MLDRATTGFYLDLTPPTDARPFFFNQLRFATLFDADVFSHFTHTGVFAGNLVATLTSPLQSSFRCNRRSEKPAGSWPWAAPFISF
jgi:hypothetical protein